VAVRGVEVEVELLDEYTEASLLLLLYMDQVARMDSKANATFSSTCSGRDDRLMLEGVFVVLGPPRPRLLVDTLGFARSATAARGDFLVGGAGDRTDVDSRFESEASVTATPFERCCDLLLE
jgi:hypothetical protein